MTYVLSCSSTADMPESYFLERDIHYVCFHYQLNGKEYSDDLGKSMSFPEFYQAMRDGAMTSTSQISAGEYEEYFENFLKEGKDILHLSLSSGISGTVQSARIAQDTLQKRYPDRKIVVMDSLAASVGYGLLMDKLADMRDAGASFEEVCDWAEKKRLTVHHWFYQDDLTYLVRGGRVSKVAGAVGGMLNLCPMLNVSNEGKLVSRQKFRGRKRAEAGIVKLMQEHAEGGVDYEGKIFLAHADCEGEALRLADTLRATFPKNTGVIVSQVGTTIGSHTGPGLIVLCFFGDERVD